MVRSLEKPRFVYWISPKFLKFWKLVVFPISLHRSSPAMIKKVMTRRDLRKQQKSRLSEIISFDEPWFLVLNSIKKTWWIHLICSIGYLIDWPFLLLWRVQQLVVSIVSDPNAHLWLSYYIKAAKAIRVKTIIISLSLIVRLHSSIVNQRKLKTIWLAAHCS